MLKAILRRPIVALYHWVYRDTVIVRGNASYVNGRLFTSDDFHTGALRTFAVEFDEPCPVSAFVEAIAEHPDTPGGGMRLACNNTRLISDLEP